MADSSGSGLTKSQKKNMRRKMNTTGENVHSAASVDPVEDLRQRLATAKASEDHTLANQIRQELWIAQDLAAGYKPQIDEEDVKGQEILKTMHAKAPSELGSQTRAQSSSSSSTTTTLVNVDESEVEEKKLKSLKKKIVQIEKLKKRKEQGEKLEKNQLIKIESEDALKEEIDHLEQLLSITLKR